MWSLSLSRDQNLLVPSAPPGQGLSTLSLGLHWLWATLGHQRQETDCPGWRARVREEPQAAGVLRLLPVHGDPSFSMQPSSAHLGLRPGVYMEPASSSSHQEREEAENPIHSETPKPGCARGTHFPACTGNIHRGLARSSSDDPPGEAG